MVALPFAIEFQTYKSRVRLTVNSLCTHSVSIEHLDITKMCKLNASFITVCYSG